MPPHLAEEIRKAGGAVPKPNKFGAKKTGRYHSKREAEYAAQLEMRRDASNGDVSFFLEQVPIRFKSGIVYRMDFLVFFRNGDWSFIEVKGFETPEWKMKMKLLSDEYPSIHVVVVK